MNNNIETFLASQNLQQHYKFVSQEVKKRTGVNIDRYPGMERQFQKMATVLANKKQGENTPLSQLNSDLKNHCTNYFCQQIAKKRSTSSGTTSSNNIKAPQQLYSTDNNSDEYQNISMSDSYDRMMAQRAETQRSVSNTDFDPRNMIASREQLNATDNSQLTKSLENALLERGQLNVEDNTIPESERPNILPFNLNDDVANMLSSVNPGEDLPLYQNVVDLNNADGIDPMKRLEQMERERNMNPTMESTTAILDYKKMDIESQQKMVQKFTTRKGESDIMSLRNNTDAQTRNQQSEIKDAAELYRLNEEGKKRMIDRMTNSSISGNDLRSLSPAVDNLLLEKLISLQRELQPKYIEKVNYIIVNSIDRDWFNTSETRYNFKVNFRPNSSHTGAGIQDIFRNITSVELVNALLPQDNVLIPFDARPYLDILHFPYLLLQIPEFSDVFRGTNNNNDRAFSVLIFDKQHDSAVLSSDFISGTSDSIVNSTPKSQFYKEYRKTFYKYTPAYFEKKQYHNQPLASLGHMTLKLATPAGEKINVLDDVLTINAIDFTSPLSDYLDTDTTNGEEGNFEYDISHSYPNDVSPSTRKYVRIETNTLFSNKLFRLGDNIKIRGYSLTGTGTDNSAFVNFINREEGHYILNTDVSDLSAGGNQGFTRNLYIAPPGDLLPDLSAVDPATYFDDTNVDTGNYTTGEAKLINSNLQTHFLFKINTREGDVAQVTMPMNV
jgi:hypothetical protein